MADSAQELHPFDSAVRLAPQAEAGHFLGATSPAHANMVGPFGGITAAQALQAVLLHPELLGEPVALTVNFAAALKDGPFTVVARPVRTNRSTQHWTIEMQQDGETALTATAFTALRRETWGSMSEAPLPAVPRPLDVPLPAGRGRVEWINRYEMRFVEGGYPREWDGRDLGDSTTRLWMRDAPPRPLDFGSLTALCDVFFPRIWLRRSTFVPLGTVTMTVYFHAGAAELAAAGDGYLLGQAKGSGYRANYFDQAAQVWSEAGELLATTHQVYYFKE